MKKSFINKKGNFGFDEICSKNKQNRKKAKAFISLAGILAPAAIIVANLPVVNAETAETTFSVNVKDYLSVSLTTPSEWASGDVNDFLRNKVSLNVSSNNANGFTASMYSKDNTDLTNTMANTETLPTLTGSSIKSSFPVNHWGYSLGSGTINSSMNSNSYGETDAGNNSSNYYPLVSTSSSPITILTGATGGNQDIYFGAKADMTQASGTYTGTVVISVVSGNIDTSTNPVTPTNPATPNPANEVATYNEAPTGGSSTAAGTTTYTYRRNTPSGGSGSTGTNTTTTQVSDGDNVSAYQGYTAPQGVIENTISNISSGSPLAVGLVATSAAAAAAGTFFFILAKHREEDDDDQQI